MNDPQGFLKYTRELPEARKPEDRKQDYQEIYKDFPKEKTIRQASRCMDCGVPFCHNGCPLGNLIPEFNEAVNEQDWELATSLLLQTNNFPEFTGRVCPAPCESACVLGINQPPVAIEHIEKTIAEVAYEKGYIRAQRPTSRTGKKVAVVGSGPAGLAAAEQLNRAGHEVTVFERNDKIGGLLRYGIPDFKLEKWVLDRRLAVMEAEGIHFQTGIQVGKDLPSGELLEAFDAVVLAGGATIARDLRLPGRELKGIHLAMDYLEQSNRRVAGEVVEEEKLIDAHGKHVVVIGGGDTGADCVGTSNRQGAKSVTQIELLAKPPLERDDLSWPEWPLILRTSSSHEEGCDRQWALLSQAFIGNEEEGVCGLDLIEVVWEKGPNGKMGFQQKKNTEKRLPCDMVLLAIGFAHPEREGLLDQLAVQLDQRGNVAAKQYQTSVEKVFVAGDMHRGQSLVVWAISEGREAAAAVDQFLNGEKTQLIRKDHSTLAV